MEQSKLVGRAGSRNSVSSSSSSPAFSLVSGPSGSGSIDESGSPMLTWGSFNHFEDFDADVAQADLITFPTSSEGYLSSEETSWVEGGRSSEEQDSGERSDWDNWTDYCSVCHQWVHADAWQPWQPWHGCNASEATKATSTHLTGPKQKNLLKHWPIEKADLDYNADPKNKEQTYSSLPRTMSTKPQKRPRTHYVALPAAIFIHAGAGFHSIQNENMHLRVCSDAALKAMNILKTHGSAVAAVEAAIKHLEDHEITNAGYGSNLTIDGTVECDATIVDHLGRSGACGAVPNIRNPISLAKVILETSSETLALRRVPPNFLVGEGAKRFGIEHGIATVTNEELVSRNARDRYRKWRADLDKVTASSDSGSASLVSMSGYSPNTAEQRRSSRDVGQDKLKLDSNDKTRKGLQRDHTSALLNGLWNEGQPDSPISEPRSPLAGFSNITTPGSGRSISLASPGTAVKRARTSQNVCGNNLEASPSAVNNLGTLDGARTSRFDFTEATAEPTDADKDMIVDTIGAIAFDMFGNIAAGSSSGGIGIKHMGRTGPAALVGVGTAVIPHIEGEDDEYRTVATVTSGTGEHMATTMAAQKCADRLFQSTRRGAGGIDEKEEDVSVILQSFVETDFMDHPGVRNQASTSAIGVMAVEATASGIWVHWAHNTESFALASMSQADKDPVTVMSRLPEASSSINIGGRKIPFTEREDSGDYEAW
ncbi:unnamed protein product [Discula destructiva]